MDMLVPLYALPSIDPCLEDLKAKHGVVIRPIHTFERSVLRKFVETHFSRGWADEAEMGFRHMRPSCLVAVHNERIVGFAAYDCTFNGFFGPTGVLESERGKGIGKALLLASLDGLRSLGYVYGIIGSVGPAEFYAKTVGAVPIPNSSPGAYTDRIKQD
jgi:predicted N-acetyltransferase YhbS